MKYEQKKFTEVVKKSHNLTDLCKNIGLKPYCGNRQTVKKYIAMYNLDISHFKISKNNNVPKNKIELSEILVEKSTYTHTTNLKKRLYDEGLKEHECELCGQGEEWNGMKISLILDHINGVNNDNRIENLRIVCPNCNAGLPTHGGKNKKNKYKYKSKKNKCIDCSIEIHNSSKRCLKCSSLSQRKVDRPCLEQLLSDVKETNYSATGRKYGVSDSTIKKWIKNYEK